MSALGETPPSIIADKSDADTPDGATHEGTSESDGEGERSAIAGRAGLVGAGTLVSRVLGLGRDLVLAALFPRALTDIFFVAFTIPNALRQLLAEGALSSSFVPVLAKVEAQEGPEAAARFYAKLRAAMWLVLLATCALGVVFAPWLCELFAAGFHARPGAFERTVAVTRTVFPYLLFMGLAALGAGALQVRKRFGVASFAPALLNVGMILGAVVLAPVLAARGVDPLHALAIGALVGGALQVLAQMPDLKKAGFVSKLVLDLKDPHLREVLKRIAPMTLGLMIYEIDLVLSRRFLSQAGEGANSWFYYAQRLCDFPQGIFSLALATATLPSLAKLVAKGEGPEHRREVAETAAHAFRLALWVSLPATALLVALARPLVVAFFARGAFDAASVDGTTSALIVQGLGVCVVALVRQVVPLYYALGDTKTPVIISGVDLLAFIAIALTLRGPWGHVGVSAAVTGSSLVQAALLLAWMRKRLPELRWSMITRSATISAGASVAAGLLAWIVARPLALLRLPGVVPAAVGLVVFSTAYLALCRAFGHDEQRVILAGLSRRLRRRR